MTNYYRFKSFLAHSQIEHGISGKKISGFENFQKQLPAGLHIMSKQVHGKAIFIVDDLKKNTYLDEYDGFITDQQGVSLIIKAADCAPLLFFDPNKLVIAAVHAGRKGTELKIAAETVRIFKKKYNSEPRDIICGIGPSICRSCYQIDRDKDIHFDLWGKNKKQLIDSGLIESNIEISGICTACNGNEQFYSFRKDKTEKRNYAWVVLKGG